MSEAMFDIKLIKLMIKHGPVYADCLGLASFEVPDFSGTGPPRVVDIRYPIDGKRHMISLMKFNDGPSLHSPVPHVMMGLLKGILEPIVEEMK